MGETMADAGIWLNLVNLGIGGMFLVLLFLGLRSGTIHTKASVDRLLDEKERRIEDQKHYMEKLELINEKHNERNDHLAGKIDQLLEVSRAHGMIDALPPYIGERIVK
jgi:hypothetical protein